MKSTSRFTAALIALAAGSALALSGAAGPAEPANPPVPPSVLKEAEVLRDRILAGSKAAVWVSDITDLAGPRLAGSPGDRAAVALTTSMLKAQGFANVRAEKVTVEVWQRGTETGEVISPAPQKLSLTALGGSVATPEGGLEGEIVRVESLAEIAALGGAARGKILFIDQPTARTSDGAGYGAAGRVRSSGPSAAARAGATGLLIRSIGTDEGRMPHTGGTHYAKDVTPIPAAALAADDAGLLTRLLSRGPVRVRFTLTCRTLPDAESANVIGEIRGREKPEEIVLLGAHLDSWDLGTGALDDAAGCGIVVEAARQIGLSGKRPRRTVRVVLFANEENGLAGGKTYARDHAAELANHVAALEVDLGQGPPLGFSWNAGPSAKDFLEAAAAVLAPIAADSLTAADIGGADLTYLLPAGIPNLGLLQDASRYFDIHHTAADTFDRIEPGILDLSTAATAAMAWALAESPERLPLIPAEKRALPSWAP